MVAELARLRKGKRAQADDSDSSDSEDDEAAIRVKHEMRQAGRAADDLAQHSTEASGKLSALMAVLDAAAASVLFAFALSIRRSKKSK
jgi:hypothetical protein